ncbi:ABC-type dipeptide transport system, periplasmic component [Bellilinea caldifistulae]|uniref:Solute-binding protein family 5 domain-containing protein n=1 Tax=Bellilinea caldifistulae TaxID=360411 RepID=A0A0P6XR59_9CHLR|nr:peptide ABC transporter substrate-binding protein [Bellilinea caldifistulae]KPL79302.1 hypothetical protein AC812_00310 [Bellilinea caldifistulae]GAP09108.1 ABC-type dipeptide transport system, periplasmic component [Bellilinea caldifistulae]
MRLMKPLLLILLATLLAACSGGPVNTPAVTPTAPLPTDTPLPTLTPVPPRELTICIGQEPQSLYLYGGSSSRAMWNILEAIYDGPFDYRAYQPQPVILESLPSPENGGAVYETVSVERGQDVLDAAGEPAVLDTGVRVLPAGCHSADCAVRWDGVSPLQMERLTLTFRLKAGLLWQDGVPLTAADSVFAFQIASDPQTPAVRWLTLRTAAYRAVDELTVEWRGIPGYLPADYALHFFLPLPQHAWGNFSAAELLQNEEVNRHPLGWGPYQIETWTPGESIRLSRNPHYFRAAEGLPRFDRLTFRFFGEPADNNIAALTSGDCDFVDDTVDWEGQLYILNELQQKQAAVIQAVPTTTWEQLTFGIRPAAYDGGYTPFGGYRQDLLGDKRTRQAIAACIDRQGLVDRLLYGYSAVPNGFFPPNHPLAFDDLSAPPFDPDLGKRLLDEAGWRDLDNDPATPRTAVGVLNVLNDTPLTFEYRTTPDHLHQMTAEMIAENLRNCGVGVSLKLVEPFELYAPGPEGALFGRNFDLAQFAWQSGRTTPPCNLFTTAQIPAANNGWIGTNISGWSSPVYDAQCAAALRADPRDPSAYQQAQRAVQQTFLEELPAVPLYFRLQIALASPQVCGIQMDAGARSPLWNIETWDKDEGCPAN